MAWLRNISKMADSRRISRSDMLRIILSDWAEKNEVDLMAPEVR